MFQVGHWALTRCQVAGAGDGPVLLLLQLLLELFLLGRQRLRPLLQLAQLSHPLLRGHGRSQV